jgi:hypothetical protein
MIIYESPSHFWKRHLIDAFFLALTEGFGRVDSSRVSAALVIVDAPTHPIIAIHADLCLA